MLVLIGKSKLFPARLASQAASLLALCEILYSIYFRLNFWGSPYSGTIYYTYNKVSRKRAKIERI